MERAVGVAHEAQEVAAGVGAFFAGGRHPHPGRTLCPAPHRLHARGLLPGRRGVLGRGWRRLSRGRSQRAGTVWPIFAQSGRRKP